MSHNANDTDRHAPLPWRCSRWGGQTDVVDRDGALVACDCTPEDGLRIVKAVNTRAQLPTYLDGLAADMQAWRVADYWTDKANDTAAALVVLIDDTLQRGMVRDQVRAGTLARKVAEYRAHVARVADIARERP